jgi:hypothetical protein
MTSRNSAAAAMPTRRAASDIQSMELTVGHAASNSEEPNDRRASAMSDAAADGASNESGSQRCPILAVCVPFYPRSSFFPVKLAPFVN